MNRTVETFGNGSLGGTYALRIYIAKSTRVAFVEQPGLTVALVEGQLVYLGSAREAKGLNTLPNRLHRHATRTGCRQPHHIRETVCKILFNDDRWRKLLPNGKTYQWQVDRLLDDVHVDLRSIYAFQHPKALNIEHALAIRIDADLQTQTIKPGLGAQDWKDGFDHLVRVEADEVWWRLIPVRMAALASDMEAGRHVTHMVESYLRCNYCLRQI